MFRPCVLIPTYNNPRTIRRVVERVREHLQDVFTIDDGSSAEAREVVAGLEREGLSRVCFRDKNGGKGAAVKTGFSLVHQLGFTHAFQIDGDGQHDLSQIPVFLSIAAREPQSLILAEPVFDHTAPRLRVVARGLTRFWVNVETGGRVIPDAMIGFRVYPLEAVQRLRVDSNHMEFDIEIAVRLVWSGVPVVSLPVRVRYLSKEEGGVSHFRGFWDNLRISWLHTRLTVTAIIRWLSRKVRGSAS